MMTNEKVSDLPVRSKSNLSSRMRRERGMGGWIDGRKEIREERDENVQERF